MASGVNVEQFEAWNGYEGQHWADNYTRYDATNAGANSLLLEAAAIRPDSRVLDIGCGTGQMSRLAAHQAYEGRVTGIDLSIPMLGQAKALAAQEGIENVELVHGDAQTYPFVRESFDIAISRFGVMFFDDPVPAFRNIGNAMRPGGTLAFVSLRNLGPESELMTPFLAIAELANFGKSESGGDERDQGPGSLSDPDRIREVLSEAGYSGIRLEERQIPMKFGDDARDAAAFIVEWGPSQHMIRSAEVSEVEGVVRHVADVLAPFETADGVILTGDIWLVTASKVL